MLLAWTLSNRFGETLIGMVVAVLLLYVLVVLARRNSLMSTILQGLAELAKGNTSIRLSADRAPGIRGLVDAFNRLAESMDAMADTGAKPTEAEPANLVERLCYELKGPLSSIYTQVDDLLAEKSGGLTPMQRDAVVRLLAHVKSLLDLLQEADDVSEIRRGLAEARRAAAALAADQLGTDRILVIEDDADVARALGATLSDVGYEVLQARTAEAGISMAQSVRPAAVVLDVTLPGNDGWYVVGELKASRRTKEVPLILMAVASPSGACMLIPADDFLVKPVSQSSLLERLARFRARGVLHRVMIVDASEHIRSVLREFLEPEQIAVETLPDMDMLTSRIQGPSTGEGGAPAVPDLLVMDLILAGRASFRPFELLQSKGLWARVPVVLLTAKHLTLEEQQDLSRGLGEALSRRGASQAQAAGPIVDWIGRQFAGSVGPARATS